MELSPSLISLTVSVDVKHYVLLLLLASSCEPVWPSGKALGLVSRRTSVRSASALLSLQKLWFMDTVL